MRLLRLYVFGTYYSTNTFTFSPLLLTTSTSRSLNAPISSSMSSGLTLRVSKSIPFSSRAMFTLSLASVGIREFSLMCLISTTTLAA